MDVVSKVLSGEHPDIPSAAEWGAVSVVMRKCFARKPEDRPSFEDICKELEPTAKTKSMKDIEEHEEIAYNSGTGNFYN